MENKIPIPTDNIFKFYALFGLLLFVFSCGSVLYVNKTTNDYIFQAHMQIAAIKDIAKPTERDLAKNADMEALLKVAVSNRKFYVYACGVIGAIGLLLMSYGFKKWHKEIQPLQDKIAKLQWEKLRHEVEQLKANNSQK